MKLCRATGRYPKGYDEQIQFVKKSPKYVLDGPTTIRLLAAFRRLYPRLGYEFDKRIAKLPHALERHRRYMDELHKKWKKQESCQHEYNKSNARQCYKCNYIRKVKSRSQP